MSKILNKPYTNIQYADFAQNANNNGQKIEIIDGNAYAVYPYETIQSGSIIDISQTPEYIALELEKAKEVKRNENRAAYETRFKAGIIYNDIKYDCDDRALLRISAQAMDNQLTNRTEPLTWFDYDYHPQILTLEEFSGLCNVIKNITTAIESKNCELNIVINNAQTFEELGVILIDYTNL